MDDFQQVLRNRISGLDMWLAENGNSCADVQAHLDVGARERAYWNYGYMVALKDVLALVGSTSTPLN